MNIVHVIPINDLQEHIEDVEMYLDVFPIPKCKCLPQPQLDPVSGGWIIKHGAFDGREALEEVNEILNKKDGKTNTN
jgi:hypothetical protein